MVRAYWVSWCTKLGITPKIWDMDTISRYIVSCDIAWYGIWYHDISRYIMRYHTPDHPETTGKQTRNLVEVYCLFWLSVSAIFSACISSVPPFLPSFCCPSASHITGLTARPANKTVTLSPQGSACCLSACMFVFLAFVAWAHVCLFFLHLFVSFPLFNYFPVFFAFFALLVTTTLSWNGTYFRSTWFILLT